MRVHARSLMLAGVLVIGVGATASLLAVLLHRRDRFQRTAASHESQIVPLTVVSQTFKADPRIDNYYDPQGNPLSPEEGLRIARLNGWHTLLANKYRRAASYPWLPVQPDLRCPDRDR